MCRRRYISPLLCRSGAPRPGELEDLSLRTLEEFEDSLRRTLEEFEDSSRLRTLAPDIYDAIAGLGWMEDGISEDESFALSALADLWLESPSAVSQLISKPWFDDGITEYESGVVAMLGAIYHETGYDSELAEMPFLDSIELDDLFALISLIELAFESPDVLKRVLAHPMVADGIEDGETAVIALMHEAHKSNPDLVDALLDRSDTVIEDVT